MKHEKCDVKWKTIQNCGNTEYNHDNTNVCRQKQKKRYLETMKINFDEIIEGLLFLKLSYKFLSVAR